MAAILEVKYFNSFLLKKTTLEDGIPKWDGSFGIPQELGGYPQLDTELYGEANWLIEEARIRGGYNNTSVDFGAKAYLVEEFPNASFRTNALIYSGIFNSRTSVNNTNVFSVGEDITRSLDPTNGSIQRLYSEDTNLIIFQEHKVSKSLIDKDAVYSAEGGGIVTSSNAVIGQNITYAGNYGISKDPLSFAVYGYRKYFTDRYRNAVLRLSQDGITEISQYGMYDYFRDTFANITSSTTPGSIIGGWDAYNNQYVVSLQTSFTNPTIYYTTVNFDDTIDGFTSFLTFKPARSFSIRSNFYSIANGSLWIHYSPNVPVGSFYGTQTKSSVTFIFNGDVSVSKVFKTVNYEGDNGWQVDYFVSDYQGKDYNPDASTWGTSRDTTALVPSYIMGAYDATGQMFPAILTPPIYRYGFDRKENKYFANLNNNSVPTDGEVIYGKDMSGIKGRFAVVKMSTDGATQPNGTKELWSAGTEYVVSSN